MKTGIYDRRRRDDFNLQDLLSNRETEKDTTVVRYDIDGPSDRSSGKTL